MQRLFKPRRTALPEAAAPHSHYLCVRETLSFISDPFCFLFPFPTPFSGLFLVFGGDTLDILPAQKKGGKKGKLKEGQMGGKGRNNDKKTSISQAQR